jgi:hypothetical protein
MKNFKKLSQEIKYHPWGAKYTVTKWEHLPTKNTLYEIQNFPEDAWNHTWIGYTLNGGTASLKYWIDDFFKHPAH